MPDRLGGPGLPPPALEQLANAQREEERRRHEKPPKRARHRKRALFIVLAVLVVLAGAGTGFIYWRKHRAIQVEASRLEKEQDAGRKILVAKVVVPKPERTLTLPGDVRAFTAVGILPKVNGYVRQVRVDKGDRVKAGQLLALIDSPETDQQVAAAKAALRLRRITAGRAHRLAPSGVISRQDLDNAIEGERSAAADYRRTRELQKYENVRAPFDGILTARLVDPGALVSATTPLFELADPSRLRVWVYVSQDAAPFVRVGDAVELTQDERPGVVVRAQVSRLADALDPRTRTMLAEIWLDNANGGVVAGVFVHATLHVRIPPLPVVPSNAILSRGDETLVAVVQNQDKLHLVPVTTGLDDGKTVQVRQGLRGGETVALDVPSELSEGARIQPLTPKQQKAGAPQARSGDGPRRGSAEQKDEKDGEAGPSPNR